jgi:hypothetical protein
MPDRSGGASRPRLRPGGDPGYHAAMRRLVPALPALLVCSLVGCEAPAPAQPAKPAEAPAPVAEKQPDDATKQPEAAPKPSDDAAKNPDMKAMLEKMSADLKESRELAAAYAAGTLGERLATGELLLVDARPPAGTDQVRYFVLNGALPAMPKNTTEARQLKAADGPRAHASLLGGEDAVRPAIFREIRPGTYTVCAVVGPPTSQAHKDYLARTEAAVKAEMGDTLDPMKMKAIGDRIQAETGYKPEKIDWDAHPLRCEQVEVTAAAASRVIVLEG